MMSTKIIGSDLWFPIVAETNVHKLSYLKQYKFIMCCRSDAKTHFHWRKKNETSVALHCSLKTKVICFSFLAFEATSSSAIFKESIIVASEMQE